MKERLVSHRLHGFSPNENSLSALEAAIAAGVRHIEIDTRVTGDGEILVFHDARLDPVCRGTTRIADHSLARDGAPDFAADPGESVPTLERMLERVAAEPALQVLLDVKDPGAEDRHCAIIERANLTDRVWIMSWWPEVLLRTHAINPRLRLALSYVPLAGAPWWLRPVRLFGGGGLIRFLGHLYGTSRRARHMQGILFRHEPARLENAEAPEARGRYAVQFAHGIPDGELGRVLAASGGAIATWPRLIDRAFVDAARAQGLDVFSFSLDTREEIERLVASAGPDLVFTNRDDLFS